ncbi:hypothetical protein EMPS_05943 [Entomortierella parvispora]|uniref:Uncharacterized protein n=1 Tax=Entomortierella parvispora TaxID=205924 RepID=A0A9P3LX88_9FUNG|nr:hypothetical protein EMPS_05943 [Entomortierella parvispora]
MSDENAIEMKYHLSAGTTLVKNKMESPAEGMPPQKTQKIGHVTSSQVLDSLPLHPITNTPRLHGLTYPPPGSGKQKNAGTMEKKPHTKSQLVSGKDRTVQTQLPFQPKSVPALVQEADADLETVSELEKQLEEAKIISKSLETELAKISTDLEIEQDKYNKEESELEQMVEDGTHHRADLERRNLERELELETLSEQVCAMESENDEKVAYIAEIKQQFEQFEYETCRELDYSELREEQEQVALLKEEVHLGQESMAMMLKTVPELEENSDFLGTEALRREVQEKEVYIQDLQIDLESFGVNLDDVLGLSINDEFEALKSRFNLTKGSSLFKEVSRCQVQLSSKYDRQFALMKHQFDVKLEQVNFKIRAHDSRIDNLQDKIFRAKESIQRSEEDFKAAEMEQLRLQSRAEDVRQEIEDVMRQLACL